MIHPDEERSRCSIIFSKLMVEQLEVELGQTHVAITVVIPVVPPLMRVKDQAVKLTMTCMQELQENSEKFSIFKKLLI